MSGQTYSAIDFGESEVDIIWAENTNDAALCSETTHQLFVVEVASFNQSCYLATLHIVDLVKSMHPVFSLGRQSVTLR